LIKAIHANSKVVLENQTMNEIDQYISTFEPLIQDKLNAIRKVFHKVLPEAEESISHKIPAFKVGSTQLYFAAFKNHIGFYPVYGLKEIEEELSAYRAKGTSNSLHFRHKKELPIDLIEKIIRIKMKTKAVKK
jgi:uncharacterized protein YdhG (YjbR/CyaY superfamily)